MFNITTKLLKFCYYIQSIFNLTQRTNIFLTSTNQSNDHFLSCALFNKSNCGDIFYFECLCWFKLLKIRWTVSSNFYVASYWLIESDLKYWIIFSNLTKIPSVQNNLGHHLLNKWRTFTILTGKKNRGYL